MKRIALVLTAALLAGAAPEEPVSYTLAPMLGADGKRLLGVALSFRGDADGRTEVALPDSWAGSSELWRHLGPLAVEGGTLAAQAGAGASVRHAPGARITLRYTVAGAWDRDPGFDYEKARPMVRPDWFFAHGEGVFATPEGRGKAPARFAWGPLPPGWRAASDLDHARAFTVDDVAESVLIGGRGLRLAERDIGGAPLRVAMLGDWSFDAAALAEAAAPVIAAEHGYWRDRPGPFLVALAPQGAVPSGFSYTGTARGDAFSIASTPGFKLARAARFLAHEYNHRWFPGALGAMPGNEGVDYWLSEGFNDYVTTQLLLGAGIWSIDEWAADKNDVLLRYGTSPARTAPAAEVAAKFWTDQSFQQLSYDRGHLLAALVDARIAARSGGRTRLGDVLRAQKAAAAAAPDALASDLFMQVTAQHSGVDVAPLVDAHARRGEFLVLPADLFGDCARIVDAERPLKGGAGTASVQQIELAATTAADRARCAALLGAGS